MAIPTPRGGWSADEVADYFIQASRTAHKLPPVRVQGHFNVWPTIVRTDYERMASDDAPVYRFPPTPAEVDCMPAGSSALWSVSASLEVRAFDGLSAEQLEAFLAFGVDDLLAANALLHSWISGKYPPESYP